MIYGYARVSTAGQAKDGNSIDAQEKALKAAGATIIYKEHYTGTKMSRPEFDKLIGQLKAGDKLIVTKLDRFARTAGQGMSIINGLLQRGVTVHVLNMGMVDNTATGKLIAQIMLAFAEFERDMIVERTQEGKTLAKQNPDFKEGRPPVDADKIEYALALLDKMSYANVAKKTGISKSTLVRYKKKS